MFQNKLLVFRCCPFYCSIVSKEKKLCTCSTLSLCIFFAVVLHDCNVKLPSYTFCGGNVVCVPVRFFLFFLIVCRSFSPGWPLAFLIFSPPLQKFLFFPPTIFVSLCFISRSSSFSVIHVSGNLVEKKTRL